MIKMDRKFHRDGTQPDDDQIFVFGSNLSGIHGGGAARAAYDFYGAEWGVYAGLRGRSYAIPTKGKKIDFIPIEEFKPYIDMFITMTQSESNADKKWFVTRIGCGLALFKDRDIAPLFKDAKNCSFAEEWKEYLENKEIK